MRVILLTCLVLLSGCTKFIFFPMKEHYITPDIIGIMYEDRYIQTADGLELHGWKLFSEGDTKATLLFFHGNAENISTHIANVYWLVEYGYDVYLFDYRGYGQSEGEAEIDPIIDDMQIMIGDVLADLGSDEKLIIMGQSLGASLSIYSVAHSQYRGRIAALVSVAAFSDYHEIAQEALSSSWMFWLFQWPLSKTINNTYSPVKTVDRVSPVPLYILHSQEDGIIGFHHAQTLYDAALEPKQLVELDGAHNATFNLNSNRQRLLDVLQAIDSD